jgi:hypothetical protein
MHQRGVTEPRRIGPSAMTQPILLSDHPVAQNQGWKPYQIAAIEYQVAKLYRQHHRDAVRQALETCFGNVPVAAGVSGLVAAVGQHLQPTASRPA